MEFTNARSVRVEARARDSTGWRILGVNIPVREFEDIWAGFRERGGGVITFARTEMGIRHLRNGTKGTTRSGIVLLRVVFSVPDCTGEPQAAIPAGEFDRMGVDVVCRGGLLIVWDGDETCSVEVVEGSVLGRMA